MRRTHCRKNLLQPLLISRLAFPAILTVAGYFPLHAHGNHKHAAQSPLPVSRAIDTTPRALSAPGIMGMEEKPGAQIPLDCRFVTETGDSVRLRDVVKGPTILSILYYSCPDACNTLVMGIANAVGPYSDKPDLAPNVLCVSVDDHETPADAMKEKNIAFESMQRRYPQGRWHFLTGDAENIRKLTAAVGFHFVKNGNEFDHPLGIIILSPEGKVTRYILGADYLPMDISLSLMQASKGVVQPTVARVLRACFSYDPKSHRFVFNILRVSATVVFSLIGLFILYLVLSGRKRRAKGSP